MSKIHLAAHLIRITGQGKHSAWNFRPNPLPFTFSGEKRLSYKKKTFLFFRRNTNFPRSGSLLKNTLTDFLFLRHFSTPHSGEQNGGNEDGYLIRLLSTLGRGGTPGASPRWQSSAIITVESAGKQTNSTSRFLKSFTRTDHIHLIYQLYRRWNITNHNQYRNPGHHKSKGFRYKCKFFIMYCKKKDINGGTYADSS